MAEYAPSGTGLPSVAHSTLVDGGLGGFEGMQIAAFEQRKPVDQLAADFYGDMGAVFGGGAAVEDPMTILEGPIEAGTATIEQAADAWVRQRNAEGNDGADLLDGVAAAQVMLRREADARLAGNGGDGDQAAIDKTMERSQLLHQMEGELIRLQLPGWDATPERRIRANGFAEAAGQEVPFPEEYRKNDDFFAGAETAPIESAESAAPNLDPVTNMEIAPAPGEKMQGIDSRIEALVTDEDWLSPRDREEALKEARRLQIYDGNKNRVLTRMGDGNVYFAKEYPTVFTFTGTVRGTYDDYPDDPSNQTPAQAMTGPGDKSTHVIIETDDGHNYLFRRTSEETHSATEQTFEVTSTRLNAGNTADKPLSRKIDSEQLKDVVVMPGHPLTLGRDPDTGRQLHTGGNVVRITSIAKTEAVAEGHPWLQDQERFRDAPARFVAAVEIARKQQARSDGGPLAVAHSLESQ